MRIDGTRTRVIVAQLAAVDHEARLDGFAGRLSAAEMRSVGAAPLAVLALD